MVPSGLGLFGAAHLQAGAAHGAIVLHVSIHVIGNLVINGDVIHLPNRQGYLLEAAAMIGGDDQPAIEADGKAIGIGGVEPDVVIVAAPLSFAKRFAAIHGEMPRAARNQYLVLVCRRDCKPDVVSGPTNQRSVPIDYAPAFAGVV